MKTIMTLQVRELKTDWDLLTIGRIERAPRSRTMILKGIDGKLIEKSASIETVAAAGRRYAIEQGYADAAYADAALGDPC